MKLILENWQNFVSKERKRTIQENWLQSIQEEISADDQKLVDQLSKLAPDSNEAKKIYRDLAKRYHPDYNQDNPEAVKDFKKINAANQSSEQGSPETEKMISTAAAHVFAQPPENRKAAAKQLAAKIAKDNQEQQNKIIPIISQKVASYDEIAKKLAQAVQKQNLPSDKVPQAIEKTLATQLPVKPGQEKIIGVIAKKATELVAQSGGPKKDDLEVETIKTKYGEAIKKILPDVAQQNAIVKFLVFLSKKKLLKESAKPYLDAGIFSTEIFEEYMDLISNEDKVPFFAALKAEGMMEFLKKVLTGSESAKPAETDNPAVVDPEPDDLVELKKAYLAFRDKFYCPIDKDANRRQRREARLRCSKEGIAISKNDQHEKVTALITALEDIIEKEEGEAGYNSSKAQLQEQTSRSIVALKADLTMFLKQARGAGNIIGKAQDTAGTKAGKYHLKKAIERAKNVLELTGDLYDDLRRISKGLGQRAKQEPPKTDLTEAAQEVEKAYDLVLSNIEDVIGDIGDDLPQSEFLPRMKKSLEGLENILKYFPKGRLGGKGSSGSGEIYTKYKEALSQFGDNFSILKNLPDELSDKDAGSTSLNVAAQQVRAFANDLVEIFGLQMPVSFNKKVEKGPPVDVPGAPDAETEQPKEDPEQVIQDLAVELEKAAEDAIQKANEELPDGTPEQIAKRAGEILAADKAAEEELRKQAETEAAAKEALEQAKQEELRKQEELAVQNAMDDDKEEGKSIPFSTERDIIKFFNVTLFKDPTIRGELERLNMDDKDFSNLKKVMAYLLSSTAEFMNESFRSAIQVSQEVSTNPKKALKILKNKEKELYNWFKGWMSKDTQDKKKLFKKIGEFLKKKNYNFNLEGLTIQRLQGLNFSAAPTDIPPKEEDAIKKTVEKVKNKLKDQYPDQDELMANVEQDVISVIQNPKNSEIFNWSTGQPSSELSSMVGDFVLNPMQNDAEGTPEVDYPNINYELGEDTKQIFGDLQSSYAKYNKKDKNADFDNDLTVFMNFLGSIKATLTEGKLNINKFKKDKTIKRVMDKNKNLSTKFYSKFQGLGVDDKKPLERVMKAILGKPGLMAKLLGLIGAKRKQQEPVQETLERILQPLIKQQLRGE